MEKNTSAPFEIKKIKFVLPVFIALAVILSGIFLFSRFKTEKNVYRVENKYYGFEIKTPKGWVAEGQTIYSEENIAQFLQKCQNDKTNESSGYEVGRFKFKSQKYPQNFDLAVYSASEFPSGIILDVTVNCVPSFMKDKNTKYGYGDLNIGGEKAIAGVLEYSDIGKTKRLSFLHNGFQYLIDEYIYLSPNDKGLVQQERICNEVISSFRFTK